jgi:plasmid stability protein
MAAITIRNISDELVDRIKRLAEQKGISMEQARSPQFVAKTLWTTRSSAYSYSQTGKDVTYGIRKSCADLEIRRTILMIDTMAFATNLKPSILR